MATQTRAVPTPPATPTGLAAIKWTITDALVVTKRNLLKYVRVPTLLIFSTIQPIMFVLLFNYVFGGAITSGIPIPGFDYIIFLMPGIFVQTAVFGSTNTGIGLAEDLGRGLIDRFRSLPMARSAVLAGRTGSDSIRNLFVILLMIGVGYLIGFRFMGGFAKSVTAVLLVLLFGYAFTWISATIGLALKDVESVQAASFVWLFPLVFASSAFVPTASMPGWLQTIADINPVTSTVNAVRLLVLGDTIPGIFEYSLQTYMLQSIAWSLGLLAIFIPLAINRYRRAV
jgi:ABC-2 type transport system permease protein/oleandomycin transport system permease protein